MFSLILLSDRFELPDSSFPRSLSGTHRNLKVPGFPITTSGMTVRWLPRMQSETWPLIRNKEKRQRKYRIHRQELRALQPVAAAVAGNKRRDNRAESHGDKLEVIENER